MNKYNKEELENLILVKQLPYTTIGKMFNVSGTAIKKLHLDQEQNYHKKEK